MTHLQTMFNLWYVVTQFNQRNLSLFQYYQYLDFIQSNVYFIFSVYLAQYTQVTLSFPDDSHVQHLAREIE